MVVDIICNAALFECSYAPLPDALLYSTCRTRLPYHPCGLPNIVREGARGLHGLGLGGCTQSILPLQPLESFSAACEGFHTLTSYIPATEEERNKQSE